MINFQYYFFIGEFVKYQSIKYIGIKEKKESREPAIV